LSTGQEHQNLEVLEFMAIEVLHGKGHTYRHDLESFFYVFTWMCIRFGHENVVDGEETCGPIVKRKRLKPITTSRLRRWSSGTYTEIGQNKLGDIDKIRFKGIIAEFAPKFANLKQLARELRSVLFPI
jgi:hypothetical protein